MRRNFRLSTQTLLLQLAIVVLTLLVGTTAWAYLSRAQLQDQYGERALAIADAVAALPTVAEAFDGPDPASTLQPLGEAVRQASGMSFVVITDDEGMRYSHPTPQRIGEPVSTDPSSPLAGRRVIEVDTGTLGTSVRGKSPIVRDGEVIGMVSVGILQQHVFADFVGDNVPTALLFLAPALALGVAGSLLLTRRVKRLTFGLEPQEIATLLEQRQAMLHGIREGVVGLDRDGRIAVVNDEAARLFELSQDSRGSPPADVVPPGPARELLGGDGRADDVVAMVGSRVLVANRMPIEVRGERVGTVVTVRDRTELTTLSRELASVRDVADALRAQAHEFDNQLHTLAGLIELGHHREAVTLITETSLDHQQRSERLAARLRDPSLVALLLTKTAVAEERNVTLTLTDESDVGSELSDPASLLTVVGNLIDNAVEAVADASDEGGRVEVTLLLDDAWMRVRVADDGPGVEIDALDRLFERGYSTKPDAYGRGLGLALVRQVVDRLGGHLQVTNDGGAVFEVRVPSRCVLTAPPHVERQEVAT